MRNFGLLIGACSAVLLSCGSSEGGSLYGNGLSRGGSAGLFATGGSGGIVSSHAGGAGGLAGAGAFPTGGGAAGGLVGVAGNAGTGGVGGLGVAGFVGSGGDMATGGITGSGGGGVYAAGAAADCNGPPCNTETGSACCTVLSGGTGTKTVYASCIQPQAACAFPFTPAHCDGPEDCTPGAVCCGTVGTLPGLFTELLCRPAAECAAPGKTIMCHPQSPSACPNGGACNPTIALPPSYGACG